VKVLVLGGGQIARAVSATAPRHHEIVSRTHADLDIVDEQAVARAMSEVKADWIVNAAAYTAVDLAEDQSAEAYAVNDVAVASLARATSLAGCRLLHLSTDFVFDGNSNRAYLPTDPTNPLSVYGASKLGGEHHVLAGSSGIVLRTSWVYAAQGKNFVLTMLRLMREKDRINVVCDQIGTPTWAASAAAAIWGLIDGCPGGGARARAIDSTDPHHTDPERCLSDPGAAARVQRSGYGFYTSGNSRTGAALAAQFKDHAG
jgi:dTDP-4-dehydrorhamnose reductase